MSARRFFARLVAVVVISAAVFLASMSLTILLRGGYPVAAVTSTTAPETTSSLPEAGSASSHSAPLLSVDPVVVITATGPNTAETTTTIALPTPDVRAPLPELDHVFDPLVDELESLLEVPVRLPADLETTDDTLLADGEIQVDGYTIFIDQQGVCEEVATCRIATFTAKRSVSSNPVLGSSGTSVPLPNGLIGRLTDGTCGLGCNNAFITWIEGDVRYSVGSSRISGSDVLDLAWRSIDRSLPAPTGPDVCGPNRPKHDGQVATVITTDVGAGSPMHWVAVCSALGIDLEIIAQPGDVSWRDVDHDGEHDLVVTHVDGQSTLFVIDENRPRAVVDLGTSERLRVADLQCVWIDENHHALDAAWDQELDFVSRITVRRIAQPIEAATPFDC